MPAGLRQFAEYQPFTPVTQTVRGLLTGTPPGTGTIVATLLWSAASPWPATCGPGGCTTTAVPLTPNDGTASAQPRLSAVWLSR